MRLCSPPKHPYWLWGPPNLLFNGHQRGGAPLGVKRMGRRADNAIQSSPEIRAEWSCTSIYSTYMTLWHAQGQLYLSMSNKAHVKGRGSTVRINLCSYCTTSFIRFCNSKNKWVRYLPFPAWLIPKSSILSVVLQQKTKRTPLIGGINSVNTLNLSITEIEVMLCTQWSTWQPHIPWRCRLHLPPKLQNHYITSQKTVILRPDKFISLSYVNVYYY